MTQQVSTGLGEKCRRRGLQMKAINDMAKQRIQDALQTGNQPLSTLTYIISGGKTVFKAPGRLSDQCEAPPTSPVATPLTFTSSIGTRGEDPGVSLLRRYRIKSSRGSTETLSARALNSQPPHTEQQLIRGVQRVSCGCTKGVGSPQDLEQSMDDKKTAFSKKAAPIGGILTPAPIIRATPTAYTSDSIYKHSNIYGVE